jgi:hypothetical protein
MMDIARAITAEARGERRWSLYNLGPLSAEASINSGGLSLVALD